VVSSLASFQDKNYPRVLESSVLSNKQSIQKLLLLLCYRAVPAQKYSNHSAVISAVYKEVETKISSDDRKCGTVSIDLCWLHVAISNGLLYWVEQKVLPFSKRWPFFEALSYM
jgi:hypothetical protein